MKTEGRISREERRKLILIRVRELFAKKGLHGATTRELAEAAGISEGLLFKIFPNKEALYHAMLALFSDNISEKTKKIMSLKPSTSTLVLIVHLLVSEMISVRLAERDDFIRLYIRSLAGDGEFARHVLEEAERQVIPMLRANIKAAIASGDVIDSPVPHHLRAWFTDRLPFVIMTDFVPSASVLNYGISREKLVKHVVWFLLRGIGLKEESIRRHYNAKALALLKR
ncbi:MAG: TetR/AcrR family transcriptional regulator [Syntrophales bacterium]|jgi:AcrR family transcriptional regulator